MAESDKVTREPLMKVGEVAEYLGLAERTIYNKVHRNEIPHKKVGTQLRFRRSEIDAWIESQNPNGEAS